MRHTETRAAVKALARVLDKSLPEGREKEWAIVHLEEAMFWANAAIARQ